MIRFGIYKPWYPKKWYNKYRVWFSLSLPLWTITRNYFYDNKYIIRKNKCVCGNKWLWKYNNGIVRCSFCGKDYNRVLWFFCFEEKNHYKYKVANYKEVMEKHEKFKE